MSPCELNCSYVITAQCDPTFDAYVQGAGKGSQCVYWKDGKKI